MASVELNGYDVNSGEEDYIEVPGEMPVYTEDPDEDFDER